VRRVSRLLLLVLVALTAAGGLLVLGSGPADAQSPESARGTLIDRKGTAAPADDEPVEGVEITIVTEAGEEIATATSDADGKWEVDLPGTGNYTATINTDTLPDGVGLTDEDKTEIPFFIRPGQARTIVFGLGASTRTTTGKFDQALQLAVEGIKFGLVIAMCAVGLSLIYGTTGLTNFSHGEMVTWGALVAWFINVRLGWQLIPAAIFAVIIGGFTGWLFDRIVWRPLRRRGTGLIAMLVISIGLSLMFRYVFLIRFGGRRRPFVDYTVQRAVDIGPIGITPKDMVSIAISLTALITVGLLLQRTRMGKAMRAVADNPDLASSSGIDTQKVIALVWLFGGGLAALGGVLQGLTEQVGYLMGFQLLLLMFAGITLGGLGTAYGALVGSFVVGLFVSLSTLYISSELKTVGALVVLILVLLVRPQGILGRAERIG